MKKLIVVGIIILLIGMSVPSTGFNEEKSTASFDRNTLYVGGDGPGNYTKIQYAIDNSSDGDTVFVFNDSSPYYENVEIIEKSIKFIGEDKNTTVIDAGGIDSPLSLWCANDVTVSGFTLQHGGEGGVDAGIYIYLSNNNTIVNNNIINNNMGIYTWPYSYHTTITRNMIVSNQGTGLFIEQYLNGIISENTIEDHFNGLVMYFANNSQIIDNNVLNNYHEDIYLHDCTNMILADNYAENGIVIDTHTSDSEYWNTLTMQNNSAISGEIRFYKDQKNVVVPDNTAQVILANCSECTIHHLNFTNVLTGIILALSYNNIVTENTFYWNQPKGHVHNCIILHYSNHNIIMNNIFHDRSIGILLTKYDSENIIANNLFDNTYRPVLLYRSCVNNFIVWNNFQGSNIAINSYDPEKSSVYNQIHHNNFLESSYKHVRDEGTNIWDNGYPSGGNYWDDYLGVDDDGDGIGDVPYNITNYDEEVTGCDRYPLRDPIYVDNLPPILINIPKPCYGKSSIEYEFNATVVDIEGELIFCRWNWGDGSKSEWIGPVSNWETLYSTHSWENEGTYNVTVNLKDSSGVESKGSLSFFIVIDDKKPSVKIVKPERAIYFNNYNIVNRLFGISLIFGGIQIMANASDSQSGIEKIELYINNKFITEAKGELLAYQWSWMLPHVIHLKMIKVIAYDNSGNMVQDRLLVRKYF